MHTTLRSIEIWTTKSVLLILTAKGVGVGLVDRSRSSVDSNSSDAELRSFTLSFEAVFELSREDFKLSKNKNS